MIALPLPAAAALAALLVVVALYCGTSAVVRLADASGPGSRRTGGAGGGLRGAAADAVHAVMAVLMVAMVVPATASLVPPVAGAVLCGLAVGGWSLVLVRDGLRAVAARPGRVPGARSPEAAASGPRTVPAGPRESTTVLRIPVSPDGATMRRGSTCGTHPLHLVAVSAAMGVMYLAMLPTAATAATRVAAAPEMTAMEMAGMHHGPHAVAASTSATSTLLLLAAVALGGYLLLHAAATATAPLRGAIGAPVAAGAAAASGPASTGPGRGSGALRRLVESPGAQHACQALMSGAMGLALLLQLA